MKFQWKLKKGEGISLDDRIHNLACFEIVLNILRMKTNAGEDGSEEVQALCGFALECMFKDTDLSEEDFFETVMMMKNKKVHKFRSGLLKEMGVPEEVVKSSEIGEA